MLGHTRLIILVNQLDVSEVAKRVVVGRPIDFRDALLGIGCRAITDKVSSLESIRFGDPLAGAVSITPIPLVVGTPMIRVGLARN